MSEDRLAIGRNLSAAAQVLLDLCIRERTHVRPDGVETIGSAAQGLGQMPSRPLSPPVTSYHWNTIDQVIWAKASVSMAR